MDRLDDPKEAREGRMMDFFDGASGRDLYASHCADFASERALGPALGRLDEPEGGGAGRLDDRHGSSRRP